MIANKACFARPATFNRSAAAPIASPLRAVPGASRRGTALLVRATPAPAPAAEPATQSATVQPQSDEDDSVFARVSIDQSLLRVTRFSVALCEHSLLVCEWAGLAGKRRLACSCTIEIPAAFLNADDDACSCMRVPQKKWMKRGLPDTVAEALSSEDISRDLLAAVIINELATRNSRILKIEKV